MKNMTRQEFVANLRRYILFPCPCFVNNIVAFWTINFLFLSSFFLFCPFSFLKNVGIYALLLFFFFKKKCIAVVETGKAVGFQEELLCTEE